MSLPSTARLHPAEAPIDTPARPPSTASVLANLLWELGIQEVYGVVGGAIGPFFDAMGRSRLRLMHFRHEAGAAFAAAESYFASGRPAAVAVTSGPGITNALTGLMAARWDGAKVLLISGGTSPAQRGRWPAQETSSYTMPISGLFTSGPLFHYAVTVESPVELQQVAWRLAAGFARPGTFVAHVNLPVGLQTMPVARLPLVSLAGSSAPGCPRAEARRYAQLLAGKRFVIWAGFGARYAHRALRALAERTGAPVMCTPRAKGVFPESHPQYIGVTGMGGYAQTEPFLARYQPDHILVLGSRLAETASFWQDSMVPPGGFIHVDVDPEVPGAAFQSATTYAVHAEVGAFAEALLDELPPAPAPRVATPPDQREVLLPIADLAAVRPQYLMSAMQQVVVEGSEAIVLGESGNAFAWAIHSLRFDEPGRFRVSSSFGSMGHAVAGVVGAALARDDKAVALVGDGSMLMNSEVSTAVQYGAKAVWIVLNDARYGMVAQGMEMQGFTPVETSFPRADFVAIARGMGADGVRVEREEEVLPALAQAMAAPGPFVVDVVVDPREPGPWMKRIQNLILQGAKGTEPLKTAAPSQQATEE